MKKVTTITFESMAEAALAVAYDHTEAGTKADRYTRSALKSLGINPSEVPYSDVQDAALAFLGATERALVLDARPTQQDGVPLPIVYHSASKGTIEITDMAFAHLRNAAAKVGRTVYTSENNALWLALCAEIGDRVLRGQKD